MQNAVWRIRDVYIGSRIRLFSIPDPGSSSKNLSILTPKKAKNGFQALKNMIRVVHPGSGCWLSPIPDPGSRGQKGTQSRIRNTGKMSLSKKIHVKRLCGSWTRIRVFQAGKIVYYSECRTKVITFAECCGLLVCVVWNSLPLFSAYFPETDWTPIPGTSKIISNGKT